MPYRLLLFIYAACLLFISCGQNKKGDSPGEKGEQDTSAVKQGGVDILPFDNDPDSTITAVFPSAGQSLDKWMHSFRGLQADSFQLISKSVFQEEDYNDVNHLDSFYALYKPALVFSPDSSQFIDLYSFGITLEKKGKKIIAIGDVDQSVTLCNLKTKEWKRIAFFGPSANMEEAVWVSPDKFLIAGTMQDDNGENMPMLLLGNTKSKVMRYFEAKTIRPKTIDYKASGMVKLKIDEWE